LCALEVVVAFIFELLAVFDKREAVVETTGATRC
jgi:hypothetical protein